MLKALTLVAIAAGGMLVINAHAQAADIKPQYLSAYAAVRSDDNGQDRIVDVFNHGKVIRSATPMPSYKLIRG